MSTFREPVFNLEELTNSDTVVSWLNRTNQIISALNSFYLVDTFDGQGICSTRADGVVTLNIDAGPGLGFNASNELVLDFSTATELSSATLVSPILSTDYFLLQRSGVTYKVKADSILPTSIKHQHTFINPLTANSIFASLITFTNLATILGNESSNTEGPRGINVNFDQNQNSGINFSAETLFRNRLPGFYDYRDEPESVNTDDSGEVFSNEAIFKFAAGHWSIDYLTENGYDAAGDFNQTGVELHFYTGAEQGNVQNYAITDLSWGALWKLKFEDTGFYVRVDEGHAASGVRTNVPAFNYTYTTNGTLSGYSGLFTINGGISFDTTTSPICENSGGPLTGPNKIPITQANGVLNRKFTNRIVTEDYTSLVVGDLVYVSTITDGVINYDKALAHPSGNSNVIGIVESIDAGLATIVVGGGEFELSSVNTLEAGVKYYLSQTSAGQFVAEGEYATGILKPVFVATGESTGILLPATSNEVTGISAITTFNTVDSSTETLIIDEPNYILPLVGGSNIKLDINSDNELEIRVIDLAGAQDTFKFIEVDGVGGTDGDVVLNASVPNDTLYFTSSSLSIFANNSTRTINFEAPNAFTNFRFTGATELEYTPESQTDTLHFVAGNGINFTENTDDSIIISATLDSVIDPTDLNYGGGLRIFVSDYDNVGTYVSLVGGDSEFFNVGHGNFAPINVQLNPSLSITRDLSDPIVTDKFVYDSTNYFLNGSGNWPQSIHGVFLPDELAGYVLGRVTPSHAGDNITQPDSKIRRLSRRDLRFFLGIAGDGYIDNINSVFNQWVLYNGPEIGTTVTAESKSGVLRLEGGPGIEITNGGAVTGPDRIKITNTGVAQNAFSSVVIKNESGTTIDSFDADTSSDSFVLKSGNFVKIDTDTNNDTAIFDISINDDYVLLGNPGTTDGMNVIDLSGSAYCLVGRAGGEIEPILSTDLKWTGITTGTLTKPTLELPYFGAVQVGTSPTPTILNAYGSEKGILKFESGNANITLTADNTTNTITISATGDGQGPTSNGVGNLFVNSSQYNFNNGVLTTLKMLNGNGIIFSSELDGSNTVNIFASLSQIPTNTILGNASGTSATPGTISFSDNTVLAKLTGNSLGSLAISAASGVPSLKNSLGIKHYNAVSVTNGTTTTSATALASTTAVNGATLRFLAGTNTSLSVSASTSTLTTVTINSNTLLVSDVDPIFAAQDNSSGKIHNRITYGATKSTATTRGTAEYFHLYDSPNEQTITILTKETVLPTNLTTIETTSSGLLLQNSLVSNEGIQEIYYHPSYSLTILNEHLGSGRRGNYNLDASDLVFTSSGVTTFAGGGALVGFSSKLLKAAASVNAMKFITDTGSVLNIASFATGSATSATTPNASMILHANTSVRIALAGALNSSTNWLQITSSGLNQAITSSGSVTLDSNVTFASGRTITFTGALIVGLTPGAHASTHKSVQTEATNGTGTGSDQLLAWQIGAVARAKPTMLNRIGIVTGDNFYDLDLTTVGDNLLYNGATTYNSTNYGSSITTANKGPMYLVVPNGTNPATAGVSGPPGQIIFVKAT